MCLIALKWAQNEVTMGYESMVPMPSAETKSNEVGANPEINKAHEGVSENNIFHPGIASKLTQIIGAEAPSNSLDEVRRRAENGGTANEWVIGNTKIFVEKDGAIIFANTTPKDVLQRAQEAGMM